jgi:hypothetical protein
MLFMGTRAVPRKRLKLGKELLAAKVGHDWNYISHRRLHYETGCQPPFGQTTTTMPLPVYAWQLPFREKLQHVGTALHWMTVIAAGVTIPSFISRDVHSLLSAQRSSCQLHSVQTVFPRFLQC